MRARPYDRAMRLVDELLRLSATDLANHLGCIHLSELNRAAAQGLARRPRWDDPLGELLRTRGLEHERAYLAHLRTTGSLKIVEIPGGAVTAGGAEPDDGRNARRSRRDLPGAAWRRRAGMAAPTFSSGCRGRAASARGRTRSPTRSSRPRRARGRCFSSACTHSWSRRLKGLEPERAHVVAPHHGFSPEPYRLADYEAYYRLVKRRLETALDARPGRGAAARARGVRDLDLSRARAALRSLFVVGTLRRGAARGRSSVLRRGNQQDTDQGARANPRGYARGARRASRRAEADHAARARHS